MDQGQNGFARRVLTALGIAALFAALLLLVWAAADVLLLAFAGILLAVFLRGLSDWLAEHTPLSGRWALAVVVLALAGLFVGGAWLMAPRLADQFDQLVEQLPKAVDQLRGRIEGSNWGRQLLDQVPKASELASSGGNVLGRMTGFASSTLGAIAGAVVALFLGLYLAFEPTTYTDGVVRLVPIAGRPRAREILAALGSTLRGWLIGKAFAMAVVGVMTAIGLWLLGIPLALILGVLTALLTFIPNLGPILSFIPAALVGLMAGPRQVLYIAALYLAIQTIESYLLTPIVQRRAIALPPALLLFSQIFLGILLGPLGVLMATPLMAVATVLVKMLYVEDTLGDTADQPDPKPRSGG